MLTIVMLSAMFGIFSAIMAWLAARRASARKWREINRAQAQLDTEREQRLRAEQAHSDSN